MAAKSKGRVAGDVVIRVFDDLYQTEEESYTNGGATDETIRIGEWWDNGTGPILQGNEGDCDSVVVGTENGGNEVVVAPSETVKLKLLIRGPALLNQDAMPTTDVDAASLTVATCVAALAALGLPIIMIREPTTKDTQTK